MSAKLASREGVTRRGHFDLQPPPHSFFGQASEAVSAQIFARALHGELSYRIRVSDRRRSRPSRGLFASSRALRRAGVASLYDSRRSTAASRLRSVVWA